MKPESAKKLLGIRKEIINAFKKGTFPYIDGFSVDTDEEKDKETDTTDMSQLEKEQSDSSSDI